MSYKFTAQEIRLYIKVLNGAPVGPDSLVPFSVSEVVNPLTEHTQLVKEDNKKELPV